MAALSAPGTSLSHSLSYTSAGTVIFSHAGTGSYHQRRSSATKFMSRARLVSFISLTDPGVRARGNHFSFLALMTSSRHLFHPSPLAPITSLRSLHKDRKSVV